MFLYIIILVLYTHFIDKNFLLQVIINYVFPFLQKIQQMCNIANNL